MAGISIYLESNKSGNTIYWNLWDTAKIVLKGKFIAIKKIEISNTYIMIYLKLLEKQE
jgi:hypothetical protein